MDVSAIALLAVLLYVTEIIYRSYLIFAEMAEMQGTQVCRSHYDSILYLVITHGMRARYHVSGKFPDRKVNTKAFIDIDHKT